ncbi:MAG: GR25 family glycosyltransferase involved in LPS biosynthesis [Paraglaciecola sp.]|jgi:GR25 family glycosyltransferase involved in LPS biosynthesis
MHKTISLSEYVKKRNGVALGAPRSMTNMLKRSLGASSFYLFWQYWNPIWGYYLSRKVMKPLSQLFPIWLAMIMTFAVSGALHDLAVTIIKWKLTFFFTPWFSLMAL